jgi:hypothetical protein
MSTSWSVTTTGRDVGWLYTQFGHDSVEVLVAASRLGYRIAFQHRPDTYKTKYIVDRRTNDPHKWRIKREFLGEFNTREDAVNMLRLLIAAENNVGD